MNYRELWTQLNDIHIEFVGEITPEALIAAWDRGDHSPCGCSICHLMEAITIAEVREIWAVVVEAPKSAYLT